MLESRSIRTFNQIVVNDPFSLSLFLKRENMTQRQFLYDLEKINLWLRQNRVPVIEIKDDGVSVPHEAVRFWQSQASEKRQIYLDDQDRIFILFLYTFIRQEPISNAHYRSLLHVSKNTVGADVKRANQFSQNFRVHIHYTREKGFHLSGTEEDKRNLMLKCISILSIQEFSKEKLGYLFDRLGLVDGYHDYYKKIKKVEEVFHLRFIEERMFEFTYLFQMIHIRQQQEKWVQMYSKTKEFIQKHEMFEAAKAIQ